MFCLMHTVTFRGQDFLITKFKQELGKQMEMEHTAPLQLKSIPMDDIFRGPSAMRIRASDK